MSRPLTFRELLAVLAARGVFDKFKPPDVKAR